MANYCTPGDVKVRLGHKEDFSSNTYPTLTEVTQEIENITNEIDFVLAGVGITEQPTDSRILGRLRILCGYGVAGIIGQSRMTQRSVPGIQSNDYLARYEAGLKDIRENSQNYGIVASVISNVVSNPILDGTMTETEYNNQFLDSDYKL